MKKRIVILFALLTVATLLFAACSNTPSVDDLQKLNDLFKLDYSKVQVKVNTKTEVAELNGNFTLTFENGDTKIEYQFDRINSFDMDKGGNIADPEGGFIVREEGQVVVRDGAIVDGDANIELNLDELSFTGFSFKQTYFRNASLKGARFEADVFKPQKFTGNEMLECTNMHVVVIRNTNANTLTSMELTYTSEIGAEVKITYVFTK